MELEFKNSKNELMQYYYYFLNHQTSMKKYRKYKIICGLPIGIILSIIVLLFRWGLMEIHHAVYPEDILYILLPTFVGVAWLVGGLLFSHVMKKDKFESLLRDETIIADEDITLLISEQGIEYNRKGIKLTYYWNFIRKVIEHDECLYIIFMDSKGIVVPLWVFNEELTKETFIEKIESKLE